MVGGIPPFTDNGNDNDNDTDNNVDVKGGGAAILPSTLAARHRHGERERMRRFL